MIKTIAFIFCVTFLCGTTAMEDYPLKNQTAILFNQPRFDGNWALRAQMHQRMQPFFEWAQKRIPIDREIAERRKVLARLQAFCKTKMPAPPQRMPYYTSYISPEFQMKMKIRLRPFFYWAEKRLQQERTSPPQQIAPPHVQPIPPEIGFIMPAMQLLTIHKGQKSTLKKETFICDLRTLFETNSLSKHAPLFLHPTPTTLAIQSCIRDSSQALVISDSASKGMDEDIYTW